MYSQAQLRRGLSGAVALAPQNQGALPRHAHSSIRAWSNSRLTSHGVFRRASQIRDIILQCFHHLILLGPTRRENRCGNTRQRPKIQSPSHQDTHAATRQRLWFRRLSQRHCAAASDACRSGGLPLANSYYRSDRPEDNEIQQSGIQVKP